MATETACPAPDDDPDSDKPHVFKAYPNGHDPQDPIVAVRQDLLENKPKIEEREDKQFAHLSESEVRKLGRSDSEGHPIVTRWKAHAGAAYSRYQSSKRNLLAEIKILSDWISVLPNTVVVYKTGSWIGDVGVQFLKWSSYLVPLGGGLAFLTIASVLGIEWIANSGALRGSGLDFVVNNRDAFTQAFAMTIGVFLLLSTWSTAEKHEWHETKREVLREGKAIIDWLFPITGVWIGFQTLDEGQLIGLPMLLVPFSMQVLVRGAFGVEGCLLVVADLIVPPPVEIDNDAKKDLIAERRDLHSDLDEVEEKIALSEQLRSRAERVIDTNEMLLMGRWRGLQEIKKNIGDARRDDLAATVAKAKKEQSDEIVKKDDEAA